MGFTKIRAEGFWTEHDWRIFEEPPKTNFAEAVPEAAALSRWISGIGEFFGIYGEWFVVVAVLLVFSLSSYLNRSVRSIYLFQCVTAARLRGVEKNVTTHLRAKICHLKCWCWRLVGVGPTRALKMPPAAGLHPFLYREILREGKRTQHEMWLVLACNGTIAGGSTRNLMPSVLVVLIG